MFPESLILAKMVAQPSVCLHTVQYRRERGSVGFSVWFRFFPPSLFFKLSSFDNIKNSFKYLSSCRSVWCILETILASRVQNRPVECACLWEEDSSKKIMAAVRVQWDVITPVSVSRLSFVVYCSMIDRRLLSFRPEAEQQESKIKLCLPFIVLHRHAWCEVETQKAKFHRLYDICKVQTQLERLVSCNAPCGNRMYSEPSWMIITSWDSTVQHTVQPFKTPVKCIE